MGFVNIGGNVIEFGKTFDISTQMMATQDYESLVLDTVLRDYQQTKRDNFPEWKGFPLIQSVPLATSGLQISWYAAVPNEIVFYDSAKEDELWDE